MPRVRPERVWFSASLAAALVLLWLLSRNGQSDGNSPSDAGSPVSVPTTIATLATATPAATSLPESEAATTSASPAVPPPSAAAGELSLPELLALLGIASEQRTGYERDLFPHWSDEDGDGCNTRWEVLIAESMTPVSAGAGCSLSGGSWFSVYDGLTFVDPADLSIDHVVALAEAWDSGASAWTPQRREAFANDLGTGWELIAVSSTSNSRKSDMDPADWLPDRPQAVCDYLADWLAVKVRWDLAVGSARAQRHRGAVNVLHLGEATGKPGHGGRVPGQLNPHSGADGVRSRLPDRLHPTTAARPGLR